MNLTCILPAEKPLIKPLVTFKVKMNKLGSSFSSDLENDKEGADIPSSASVGEKGKTERKGIESDLLAFASKQDLKDLSSLTGERAYEKNSGILQQAEDVAQQNKGFGYIHYNASQRQALYGLNL